jgi:hypothetical protein
MSADLHAEQPTAAPNFLQRHLNRRVLAIALALHLLIALIALWSKREIKPPVQEAKQNVMMFSLPKPVAKPIPTPPQPPQSKRAVHRSTNGGAAKSPAPAVAMLPLVNLEAEIIRTAVLTPEVNLAPISTVATVTGTGGTAGVGIAGSGSGRGTGAGNGGQLFAPCDSNPDRPIVADVYQVAPGYNLRRTKLRDAVSTICMTQLDVTPRDFTQGFPGLDKMIEWFSLDVRFTVNVPEAGPFDLLLLSDDGAILYIDKEEVVNNDGLHEPLKATSQKHLTKGLHDFRVRYYQGPGEALALVLAWKKPADKDFGYISKHLLSRPRATNM